MRSKSLIADLSLPREEFNDRDFRNTLGAFATGVTVITTRGPEHHYGMTASAFSSVSLDPPLILVCIAHSAAGSEAIDRNRVFAVNVLSAHQEPISRYFSSKERPRGQDAFREVPHRGVVTGAPVLEGVAAYLDCSLHSTHDAGDHRIFVGEVLALGSHPGVPPLLFHGGGYRYLREA
jgi:flavin reductase (DIM6/NTAB) family NADH-FMN oxidoreductase RutF